MRRLFRDRWGTAPRSMVFPRNQVAYTDVLEAQGISRWRENPEVFFWSERIGAHPPAPIRLLRIADALAPLGRRTVPLEGQPRASHFIRFALPELAWRAHLERIRRDARTMRPDQAIHLWWHPHNLGAEVERGIHRLGELLDAVGEVVPLGTRFAAMDELDAPALRSPGAQGASPTAHQ
jgi:hypothetical protein